MSPFTVWVPGRPAPQGSKKRGAAGQMREQSVYLPKWKADVKKAVLQRFVLLGIKPEQRPVLRGALGCAIVYHLDTGQRIDSPPDLDKLTRATWDALGPGSASWKGPGLIEDDGRFVVAQLRKVQAVNGATGADITVWQEVLAVADE